jgi:pyruvate dehydrogenase E1 component alpha subunit
MSESETVAGPRRWFDEPSDEGYEVADLERMFRTMVLMRRFDEKVDKLWEKRLIPGPTHTYIGMEAGGCGVLEELPDDGYLYSYYRSHGHAMARGLDPQKVMAEILGRATGLCGGKGGSMHLTDVTLGHLGANGIVGAGAPQAVGTALAAHLAGENRPVVNFFGDGASSIGSTHEAMNLASVWNLPVIFVCENNGNAVSTRAALSVSVEDVSVRAVGYGMPGHVVDGQDVIAVNQAAREAFAHAAAGNGPAMLELKTQRYRTHSAANPIEHRTEEELAPWIERDPLIVLRSRMESRGVAGDWFDQCEADVAEIVEAAAQFAIDSPQPDEKAAMEDVYV